MGYVAPYAIDSITRRDSAWFNSFFTILKLSNHIKRYKIYYLKNKGHAKPEDYLKINAFKKF